MSISIFGKVIKTPAGIRIERKPYMDLIGLIKPEDGSSISYRIYGDSDIGFKLITVNKYGERLNEMPITDDAVFKMLRLA